jgi:hypothetical protein
VRCGLKEEFDLISRAVQMELDEALDSGKKRTITIRIDNKKLDDILVTDEHNNFISRVRAWIDPNINP